MASLFGTNANETITPTFVSGSVLRIPVGSAPTSGADYISAGAGNDTINGGGGSDTVDAGDGNDYVYAGIGIETLDGGAGTDWLNTTSWSGNYTIDMTTGVTNYAGERFVNFENLVSGSGNDSITGTSGANYISTGIGNDTIRAGDGNDSVYGGAGSDSIDGGAGNDYLSGSSGNDTITGGGGVDTVYGGDGADVIRSSGYGVYSGEAGNDTIYAGNGGGETLDGGSGTDHLDTTAWSGNYVINMATGATNWAGESFVNFERLTTGSGADQITGTGGGNYVSSGSGADTVNAGAGNDSVYGGNDNDLLNGGSGNDYLSGGSGNDTLDGESGVDTLVGGSGSDTFDFESVSHSRPGARDVIEGFDGAGIQFFGSTEDRIDLSTIDANTLLAGNNAFVFRGVQSDATGLSFGAGSLWVDTSGTDTIVKGSVNGDLAIDLEIRIADGGTLASTYWAGDFVL